MSAQMKVIQTEFNQGPNVRPQDIPFRTLARHLQLRLRYARLKVDHGWQKQSINEVENLYFHQQHFRNKTTDSHPAPAPAPVLAPLSVAQTDAQASSSKAADLTTSISVFNSRQTPSEILILRPAAVSTGHDDTTSTNNIAATSPAPPAESAVSTTPNRAELTPRTSDETETGGGDVPAAAASGGTIDSSATTSTTEAEEGQGQGQGVEEATGDSTEAREDGVAPTQTDTPSTPSSHGTRKQTASPPSTSTHSSRSALTYDSFWSSHSSSVVTYGYGPYVQSTSRTAGQTPSMTIPAKRPAPTDADTAMLESR